MLASACPGWVCYAEKTQAAGLLPHISSAKSPQAIMGAIVKRRLAALRGWEPGRLYHCSVMPCYDKKLEASRDDFYVPGGGAAGPGSCRLLRGCGRSRGLGRFMPTCPNFFFHATQGGHIDKGRRARTHTDTRTHTHTGHTHP